MADTNALFDELKRLSKDEAKQLEEQLRAKMPKKGSGSSDAQANDEPAADSAADDSESGDN